MGFFEPRKRLRKTVRKARFSPDRVHRYTLYRKWGTGARLAVFIMLNPSTADEKVEDPTVRRCMNYAQRWGYDGLYVLNLFALRSTDPKALYSHPDPVGPENDATIQKICCRIGEPIICAWGVHGGHQDRDRHVLALLKGLKVQALRITKDGYPEHPLYLPKNLEPTSYGGRP